MKIDWASLGLVAVTTVVAAISIVCIFALGVAALTHAPATGGRPHLLARAQRLNPGGDHDVPRRDAV